MAILDNRLDDDDKMPDLQIALKTGRELANEILFNNYKECTVCVVCVCVYLCGVYMCGVWCVCGVCVCTLQRALLILCWLVWSISCLAINPP